MLDVEVQLKPYLAGLQLRLHTEPYQTGSSPSTPDVEPRKTRSVEHFGLDRATKSWLIRLRALEHPLPALPPSGHAADGCRRGAARGEEGGWWELTTME